MNAPLSPMQRIFMAAASRPDGLSCTESVSGLSETQARSLVKALRIKGLLHICEPLRAPDHKLGRLPMRYFASAEGMADYVARTGANVISAPAKPLIKPFTKHRDVSYFEPAQKLDKAAKVVIPLGAKIIVAPAFVDTRYAPEPGFVGQFAREWAERRAAA